MDFIRGFYSLLLSTTIFGYNVGVLRPPPPPRVRHIERTQNAQFYAPTEASIKEF